MERRRGLGAEYRGDGQPLCERPLAVVCLAGKPPRPGTILDDLIQRLGESGVTASLELPHPTGVLASESWPDGALIVHRGLSRSILRHLAEAEARGWRVCNGAAASLGALDRPTLMERLARDRVPVPRFEVFADWTTALAGVGERDVVVKAADGAIGRGDRVMFSFGAPLPAAPPFAGPYLVEERVVHDGVDRKLYVAGAACFGLLKPWPRTEDPAAAFDPPDELKALARAAGRAAGLEIYGLDVVIGPRGPVVVDVNVFPGFRGVAGAGEAVAAHVMRRAGIAGTAR